MSWMKWTAIAAGLMALVGCGYGYRMAAVSGRYSADTRPDASYFCYDCHGYRYFDPYYDYCESYGFRFRWSSHPRVAGLYRARYVRIKESHPDYGRYRYREGYRATTRYREPRDYEAWRGGARERPDAGVSPDRKGREREKQKEKPRDNPGKKKERKGDERKGPRDSGLRSTLRGGV